MEPQEHLAPVIDLFDRSRSQGGAPADSRPADKETPAARPTFSVVADVDTPTVDELRAGIAEIQAQPAPEPGRTTSLGRPANVSMHALTRRGMSVAEMTDLLERREIEPEEVEAEITRLERVGLLDDQALAENLVRTLTERKGMGRQAVAAELRRRKVDDAAASEALEAIDTESEIERAIEVATKRAQQLASYDAETAKRRLGAFLQRRGYSGSVLSAAMNAALSGTRTSGRTSGGPRFH